MSSSTTASPDRPELLQMEDRLVALSRRCLSDGSGSARPRGRPQVLPAMVLWTALTLGVLKGQMAQVGIWRLITGRVWWDRGMIQISKEAVYHRLNAADSAEMAGFFADMTDLLLAERDAASGYEELAPFATGVYGLDESTLPALAKRLPALKALPAGNPGLLAGKLTATFDLRRHLFHSILIQEKGMQNERVAAREAIATLPVGALVLCDLGYFSFAWFDDLEAAGYHYISRFRAKTSYETIQVLAAHGTTRDSLIWLGKHRADRAKHPVRLIEFTVNGTVRRYITNVRDPATLSIRQVADLYALRWTIERAFNLVKTDLQLSVLWSSKHAVCRHQIWAVLLIAQLILAARAEVATRAACPLDWVSIPLLVQYLPQYALTYDDPIGHFAEVGRFLEFIRPPRRVVITVPDIPADAYDPPRTAPYPSRSPRYAGKQ